ncbi:non-specific serine/threonine protein kinase [Malassezia yamatoensis]|uniref:Non-specific serine/threonine protein kinase n=1 Tax=Malassezia yamatoensis TaxID=253288 RepID=A0AAJ6CHD5_9BASI|nr:non-specific serine/threonine protein kinase [Malassezia yamatoensis]
MSIAGKDYGSAKKEETNAANSSSSGSGQHHSHNQKSPVPHTAHPNPKALRESLHAMSQELADGSRQINQYHILRPIGNGSYGSVFLGQVRDDKDDLVAIKEFGKMRLRHDLRVSQHRRMRMPAKPREMEEKSESDPLWLVRTEVAIMKKLNHPNVIKLYEVLEDSDREALYMVYEYCFDGSIVRMTPGEKVEPLNEITALKYFGQILSGIDYLHEHGIAHRDIKPDNILLTDNRETCKIVDFGVSKMFVKSSDDNMIREAGSPAFMSPALCRVGHRHTQEVSDDVWSFGVTFYCMVCGKLPFYKQSLYDLYESIQNDPLDLSDELSPECRDLLSRMLEKDEARRITIREIYDHPWVKKAGAPSIPSLDEIEKNMVVEITEEDMQCAIRRISSMFAVARAVSKFKRSSTMRSDSDTNSDSISSTSLKQRDGEHIPRHVDSPVSYEVNMLHSNSESPPTMAGQERKPQSGQSSELCSDNKLSSMTARLSLKQPPFTEKFRSSKSATSDEHKEQNEPEAEIPCSSSPQQLSPSDASFVTSPLTEQDLPMCSSPTSS